MQQGSVQIIVRAQRALCPYLCTSCNLKNAVNTQSKQAIASQTEEVTIKFAGKVGNNAFSCGTSYQLGKPATSFGEHPVEMGLTGKENDILQMLREDRNYQKLFAAAFDKGDSNINLKTSQKL
ncbi:di-heme cytochrome c peroxidase [Tolypothrix sp. NIES-4075]|uniref:hypothetical protein n=1 Tax=Tolypothrix sp. NIES-4075 TaxID=2005459 RepID=UPI000B66EDF0|nr:hypothetical protein [Tolypothrix sp. NIES-4075]GAX44413.1 di-heme cytochrome c peroxidase [Tolypothrix sp. NIES-4075]